MPTVCTGHTIRQLLLTVGNSAAALDMTANFGTTAVYILHNY